jgi:hypothetical protein
MRKTLAEFNHPESPVKEWDQYLIQQQFAVGFAGEKHSGSYMHLLSIQKIVDEIGPHKPKTLRVGQSLSSHAVCGVRSNGQHTAYTTEYDTDAVTCQRCIKKMGW